MSSRIAVPTVTLPASHWRTNLGLRLRRHLAVKTIGITAFTWLFFIGYFHLLRQPAYPTMVMPRIVLDAAAGALLGIAFALPSLYWRPGRSTVSAVAPAAGIGGSR